MPSTSIERKIDSILSAIEKLDQRLDKIDTKIERIEERVNDIEFGFKNEIKLLKKQLENKASKTEIAELNERITSFENSQRNLETDRIMADSYDKRLNLLIHGLDEAPNNVWEKRCKLKKFWTNF